MAIDGSDRIELSEPDTGFTIPTEACDEADFVDEVLLAVATGIYNLDGPPPRSLDRYFVGDQRFWLHDDKNDVLLSNPDQG
ncbi:MAG TPA: hypothetical protein VLF90_03975 [Patescibacteria group bacterium]|nr:hypothetical protein [Patescibacteria group bacterium]